MKKQRFVLLNKRCQQAIEYLIWDVVRNSHPLFKQMGESIIYEGDAGEITDGSDITTSDFASIRGEFKVEHEIMRKVDLESFRKALTKGFRQIHQNQHSALFEGMNQILDKANRSFDAGGRMLTWELLMETWENIEFIFDNDGNWVRQELYSDSPQIMTRIHQLLSERDTDPEKKQQWDTLMSRKRQEFYAKESNRKLVD